jgi:hypothetical protein
MQEFLFHYHPVHPTTWVYLSSLLTIAVYFKFNRLWSIRNLDLIGLILLAPGLLLVEYGTSFGDRSIERMGFIWLFATGGLFLLRLLLDPMMVRRPLLEPNMTVGGLTFVGVSLFLFLMANVLTSTLTEDDLAGPRLAERLAKPQEIPAEESSFAKHGPGYPPLFLLPHLFTQRFFGEGQTDSARTPAEGAKISKDVHIATSRAVAILANLSIVIGIVLVGSLHFENIKTGIAAATLYLMLPYTAQYTGRVYHVLPAGLLVWAIVFYRRPLFAGAFMGLSIGVVYYPAFLLPLWLGFYWQRGLLRFGLGVLSAIAVLVGVLAAMSNFQVDVLLAYLRQMFGLRLPIMDHLQGIWELDGIDPFFRIPVLATFLVLSFSLALWPPQKNLGTLISCSAAVMLGTQFWHAHAGGLLMAWYLPLLIMTIFRPNLEDRVALSVLGEGWFQRRKSAGPRIEQAA